MSIARPDQKTPFMEMRVIPKSSEIMNNSLFRNDGVTVVKGTKEPLNFSLVERPLSGVPAGESRTEHFILDPDLSRVLFLRGIPNANAAAQQKYLLDKTAEALETENFLWDALPRGNNGWVIEATPLNPEGISAALESLAGRGRVHSAMKLSSMALWALVASVPAYSDKALCIISSHENGRTWKWHFHRGQPLFVAGPDGGTGEAKIFLPGPSADPLEQILKENPLPLNNVPPQETHTPVNLEMLALAGLWLSLGREVNIESLLSLQN